MKSVAIISKPSKPELREVLPQVLEWLKGHGYEIWMDHESALYVPGYNVLERGELGEKKPKFVLVLGGDGTLLSAGRAIAPYGIPILGVNLGSLGFLTEVPLSEMYATLDAIDTGCCNVEQRSMLHCELSRKGQLLASYPALNDAVLNKSAIARLVQFDLQVDGSFVLNYRADGVIISTPTGSTAYSLAAGGPILMPSVDAVVITPVCPHSLTHRPLVVRDTAQIQVQVKTDGEEAFLTIDGQVGMPVVDGDVVRVRKSEHRVTLLRMRKTFFEVLRNKLKWG